MIDKFYVSSQLPIVQLGYYGVASSVSFGLLRLSYPVFTAFLPRIVQLQSNVRALLHTNLRLMAVISAALTAGVTLYLLFGQLCLQLWLNNEGMANDVYPVLNLLLVSSSLNVFYNLGYTNWVAAGKSRIIFAINIASFVLAAGVTPLAIDRFGLVGAAAALVLINSIGAFTSLVWLVNGFIRRQPAIDS